MNENERIVCDFLRKIAPSREWEYLGEVEHYWIGELCGELNKQLKAENEKLHKLLQGAVSNYMYENCGSCWGELCDECDCIVSDHADELRELGIEVRSE